MGENVLVIGYGGREHALAWKLKQSPKVETIYVAPGNGGTWEMLGNIPLHGRDVVELADFAEKHQVGLTIVGGEDALALGIVDLFQSRELPIFGPTKFSMTIEASKAFAKRLMSLAGIPTAPFEIFSGDQEGYEAALAYIRGHGCLSVIKASGLAAGKGVRVCNILEEEEQALREMMLDRVYGTACNEVVIEDFIPGPEVSIHALCDGNDFQLFPPSQDHKSVGDGDRGENTGGMGAVSPLSQINNADMAAFNEIVRNILVAMEKYRFPFTGCLYPGFKMTPAGPQVLEVNGRFGDPETQVYMPLLKNDLFDVLKACVEGKLSEISLKWRQGFAVCVVMASGGYPGKYETGFPIYGIDEAEKIPGVTVFHAGTRYVGGQMVTSGGRVVGVTAVGDMLKEAIDLAYLGVRCIKFEGMHYRTDIGKKAMEGGE